MNKYEERLRSFDEALLEGYSDPGELVKIGLSPEFAASLPQQSHSILSTTALALARFASHVQYFGNQYAARASNLKRTLEYQKAKTIGGLEFKAKDTDKSKLARAYEVNSKLLDLEQELAEAEEQAKHYDRMPEAIHEYINIIKYELRYKQLAMGGGKYNAAV